MGLTLIFRGGRGDAWNLISHLQKKKRGIVRSDNAGPFQDVKTTERNCNRQFSIIISNAGEDIVFLATDINLPGAVDWVMMQSCFGHHFMLVLEKQEKYDGLQQFYAIVQLIGTRKQAENFAYRLFITTWIYWNVTFESLGNFSCGEGLSAIYEINLVSKSSFSSDLFVWKLATCLFSWYPDWAKIKPQDKGWEPRDTGDFSHS